MIPVFTNPRPVYVGHWHIERPQWKDGVQTGQCLKEVRFDTDADYIGLLHGFGVEGEHEEMYCFALVEKSDGTFHTPSVTVIRLITPTLSGPA